MELKDYQQGVLTKFDYYLTQLSEQKKEAEEFVSFQKKKGKQATLLDYSGSTWNALVEERRIDTLIDRKGKEFTPSHISRFDGLNRTIPNICFKVPTAGGKTLLAVAALERLQTDFFKQQTGMVLWVVPSDSIYKQTWKQLANREHPYRQLLERTSGGRVTLLEKHDAFTKRDTEESLCVMLLMLQSGNRKSKETLRMFRDGGRFTSFFPTEDDSPANEALLSEVRNLDCNDLGDYGWSEGIAPGSVSIKQSLGNILRLVRPVVVIDEGHRAYSETARDTLCGFNPKFILELSATPNANGKHFSNVLVNVSGTALKKEQMIKLPINLINEDNSDWKRTLALAHAKLAELDKDAQRLQNETGRYIRPIMLVRVERTGKDQRDSAFVHAEDAREYLIKHLGVLENEIRLKTSDKDELGDDDLLQETCSVKYIITKDALREGWDCPFAYVLTVLSKMTAPVAITQMIGRVLRQPHVTITQRPSLDQCYVFTFNQNVSEAVQGVKKGLEDEGIGDLSGEVQAGSDADKIVTKTNLQLRKKFSSMPKIFLPHILHKDSSHKDGFRYFDYERDILGDLDWEVISFVDRAKDFELVEEKPQRVIKRIDYIENKKQQDLLDFKDSTYEDVIYDPQRGLDIPFLVRQLMEVIPNPWQATRILNETLQALRDRYLSNEQIYTNRLELLHLMKLDLKSQVLEQSEALFKRKLNADEITLRLHASQGSKLNWELARTLEVKVSEDEKILRRKDGANLEKSLFETVYQGGLNSLEMETAWYLDKDDAVYWWHRIAVHQREYSLQGWQKQKIYPDFLVCIEKPNNDARICRFSVLETKGEHLKGNDDTEYKRQLFELLTKHNETVVETGELTLEATSGGMIFKMLMGDNFRQEIAELTR